MLNTEAQRAAQEFLHTFIDGNERKRQESRPDADTTVEQLAEIYMHRKAGRDRALEIVRVLEYGQALGMESDSVRRLTDTLIRHYDLKIETGSAEYNKLCREVQKNYITMWKTESEHAVGNYDTPYDMARRVSEPIPEADKPLLSSLIELYVDAKYISQHKNPRKLPR